MADRPGTPVPDSSGTNGVGAAHAAPTPGPAADVTGYPGPRRRTLLGLGAALAGGAGAGLVGYGIGTGASGDGGRATGSGAASADSVPADWAGRAEPFHGPHQSGILTDPQAHATFLALDLLPGSAAAARDGLTRLLRQWTDDASRLQRGIPTLGDPQPDLAAPPSRLTVTVGVGRGALDRTGLTDRAPAWLAPLPAFGVDRLEPRWSEGDVVAQVCAEDPIVLAHAVRSLLIDATGIAVLRWQQRGFRRPVTSTSAMRNLMGQVDGTVQPDRARAEEFVWVGDDGPAWLRGGSSLVIRRIRMLLDTWDKLDPAAKEAVIGRTLRSGAPLTGSKETDTPDLDATVNGLHVIPDFAHIRHAAAVEPGQRILRRPYNYDDTPTGADTSDAGLLFAAFQRDPSAQFVPIQRRLDGHDLLNVWTVPIGSAVFAMFPGTTGDGYLGQALLEG